MMIVGAIGLGLLLFMAGAIVMHMGNQNYPAGTPPTPEQVAGNANLRQVWGPSLMDIGMFFFVGGLLLAGIALEDLDPFVRLFLLILAFIALLLILASPSTIFG